MGLANGRGSAGAAAPLRQPAARKQARLGDPRVRRGDGESAPAPGRGGPSPPRRASRLLLIPAPATISARPSVCAAGRRIRTGSVLNRRAAPSPTLLGEAREEESRPDRLGGTRPPPKLCALQQIHGGDSAGAGEANLHTLRSHVFILRRQEEHACADLEAAAGWAETLGCSASQEPRISFPAKTRLRPPRHQHVFTGIPTALLLLLGQCSAESALRCGRCRRRHRLARVGYPGVKRWRW